VQRTLLIGAGDCCKLRSSNGKHSTMSRARRQVVRACDLPIRVCDVVSLERDISTARVLVHEEVELFAIHIIRVRLKGCWAFNCLCASIPSDTRCYDGPSIKLCKQRRRALLDDVGAAGNAAFVFGEAVVLITLLQYRRVNAGGTSVLPDLGLAEGNEVLGGCVEHAVVRRACVRRVVFLVQRRCPENNVGLDVGIVVSLRRPSIACCRWRYFNVTLRRPCLQITRLPDFEITATIANSRIPGCTRADRKVGSNEEELISFVRLSIPSVFRFSRQLT
jgi:hypothetical protein